MQTFGAYVDVRLWSTVVRIKFIAAITERDTGSCQVCHENETSLSGTTPAIKQCRPGNHHHL